MQNAILHVNSQKCQRTISAHWREIIASPSRPRTRLPAPSRTIEAPLSAPEPSHFHAATTQALFPPRLEDLTPPLLHFRISSPVGPPRVPETLLASSALAPAPRRLGDRAGSAFPGRTGNKSGASHDCRSLGCRSGTRPPIQVGPTPPGRRGRRPAGTLLLN